MRTAKSGVTAAGHRLEAAPSIVQSQVSLV